MPEATYHFPRGFLWGAATAAHQVEGNNTNNNWWKWEQDGHTNGTSGPACDWWGGRWREDFDRAAEAGQNAHRLSVDRGRGAFISHDHFALTRGIALHDEVGGGAQDERRQVAALIPTVGLAR